MPRPTESSRSAENTPLAQRWARRRSVPDYTQRSVKVRLFGLLALLLLVLAVAERARDPKAWKWLFDLNEMSLQRDEPFDPRIPAKPLRMPDDLDTFVINSDEPVARNPPREGSPAVSEANPEVDSSAFARPNAGVALPRNEGFDPVARTWHQGWKDVVKRLAETERTTLYELLYLAETRQPVPPERHALALQTLASMGQLWEDYQAAAFQSLSTLPASDQTTWVDVLRQTNQRWSVDIQPSLRTLLDGRTPSENEEQLLASFQATLDTIAIERVEDDTVFLRPAEREMWLRLEGKARDATAEELAHQSVGTVGYLQLFKQPDEYRGKAVTIRGTVKSAYRVAAHPNYLGIKDRFVLWIAPEGGPTSPIVVYALELPEGFPAVPASDSGTMIKLDEPVTVTGFFLKRGAYLGKDATYAGPLLIAKSPHWQPVSTLAEIRSGEIPTWLGWVGGVAVVFALIASGMIYAQTRRKPALADSRLTAAPKLSGIEIGPSTAEALRQLEDQERRSN
jgi:hypothetical protein